MSNRAHHGDESSESVKLYLPASILAEQQTEARRQSRSLSWLNAKAWQIAREQIRSFPAAPVVRPEAP